MLEQNDVQEAKIVRAEIFLGDNGQCVHLDGKNIVFVQSATRHIVARDPNSVGLFRQYIGFPMILETQESGVEIIRPEPMIERI